MESACNMECLSPLSIPRHGGQGAADRQQVPCGKCMACLQTKRAQWSFRLREHLRISENAHFVTLTYDDSQVPIMETDEGFFPVVDKLDVQNFIKRLRKATKNKISYFLVSEYGSDTHRPHYHAIMFNLDNDYSKATAMIQKAWSYIHKKDGKRYPIGFIKLGTVTDASIHYVTKYAITKSEYDGFGIKPFALISKGIGKSYLDRCTSYHDGNVERSYVTYENGIKAPLPRYYKERLYSPEERELMAQRAAKRKKTPEELFPNSPEPFKAFADAKEYYHTETIKTTKSKIV